MIDAVQRIGPPPARSPLGEIARETLTFVIDGAKQPVEIERQERPRGGAQGYWLCPTCSRRCCHLYVLSGSVGCRLCLGPLDYRSRHTLNPALTKAAKLRRKLGAAPGLLSAIPKRPPRWRRDHWSRLVRELAAAESVIAEMLGATVRALERRKGRLHGPR